MAAEDYLLGRFHLYVQVYMHKTTRSAEKMLGVLLGRLAELVIDSNAGKTGLPDDHPLYLYFNTGGDNLKNYLALDDAVIWGSLPLLENSEDNILSELAERLRNRKLYKCLDVGALAKMIKSDIVGRFRKRLSDAIKEGRISDADIIRDRATVSAYKFREYESPNALSKITIRRPDGSGRHEDVAELSPVIKALGEEKIFRVYARDDSVLGELRKIWKEAVK